MIQEAVKTVMSGEDLSKGAMIETMQAIMSGDVPEVLIAAFLTALKIKGESVSEIVGGAMVLREKAIPLDFGDLNTVDTCGTGGDGAKTYNISTAASFVLAASGAHVVKHGNRSVSSKCGAADVLEALGAQMTLTPEQVKACVLNTGIGFLFAPTFHQAMRHVGSVRKTLGFRSIFNIVGPLANPANAKAQLLGVYEAALVAPVAQVLMDLGVKKAMVVHGMDGLDEISLVADTLVCEVHEGTISRYTLSPKALGFKPCEPKALAGGDAKENAAIIVALLNGEEGPKRDILLLNAGAALYVAGQATSLARGIKVAADLIDSGAALEKLNAFIKATQKA